MSLSNACSTMMQKQCDSSKLQRACLDGPCLGIQNVSAAIAESARLGLTLPLALCGLHEWYCLSACWLLVMLGRVTTNSSPSHEDMEDDFNMYVAAGTISEPSLSVNRS